MKHKFLCFFILFFSVSFVSAQELPHYELTIAPADLDSMYAHPQDEIYYPAVFRFGDLSYDVQARFKGSTTLSYPKKSWAIKFDNTKNCFGASRINLHADYKDHSAMRNFLIMRLFSVLGSPASLVKHVTYAVNGKEYGLYLQVEQIDNEYLARNLRAVVSLYKSNNHGALMAPSVVDDHYRIIWDIEAGGDPTYNELRVLFNKCLYWSKADFNANIANEVDVDNFLNFFAVHFVFTDMDNFTKNIFLNRNSISSKFELLPWDNEGSFGNSAIGVFDSTLVNYNMRDSHTPEYQVVFQRLLENPAYKSIFKNKINRILTDGFSYLDTLIDNTYQRIKPSVYADTKKEGSNEKFETEITRLKWFMANRKVFLQANDLPERNALSDFYSSNPFPTDSNPLVTFRVTSPVPQHVNMFFADSVNFKKMGEPFKFSRFQLYDDGLHDDLLADDLIYGNTIDVSSFKSTLVPFGVTGAEQNYPVNGIFYVDYYRSKSYAINKGNIDSYAPADLKIQKVYTYNNQSVVEIINTSVASTVDLSYCHLKTSSCFYDFMFREQVLLAPNETIYVAPNTAVGTEFFEGKRTFANLYFNINAGDSLHLLSPVLSPLTKAYISDVQTLVIDRKMLVINEINYKSGASKPTGDWVEIYNPGSSEVDMTGWVFKDGENKHKFTFPNRYKLAANGYVVIAEDLAVFSAACPEVDNVVGSTGFGLSGSGEYVRIYDNLGQLVDSVNYSDNAPWPLNADGTGATIELKDHLLDNTDGNNWFADELKNGSPGVKNSFISGVTDTQMVSYAVYPNPAHEKLFIRTTAANTRVDIFTLQGAVVRTITLFEAGTRSIEIDNLPKGMYLIHLTSGAGEHIEKIVVN
ncbi:MAG: CotH kinase family protein [Paludibacter sp.]